MQELIIKNVKTAEYNCFNLNKLFGSEPDKKSRKNYEYQKSVVSDPHISGKGKLSAFFHILQPGNALYPYHYHTENEAIIYIISGRGTLRTAKGEKNVSEGDMIVMPANKNGAHQLMNTSDAPIVYININTAVSTETVVFPDTGKIMIVTDNMRKTFKIDSEVSFIDGE